MSTSLTYFDFDGSRGLECRLALSAAGVPFEDVRLNRAQWAELKPSTPYGALPILTVDGRVLAQSTAILNFIGRSHGMQPTDPWTAARHDAVMQSVEDLRQKVPGGRDTPDEEKKTQREAFAQGWLSQWANTLSDQIAGPFLEGDTLNVADIKLYVILRAYLTGGYDHIPAATFDAWPKIGALYAAVDAHPGVRKHLSSR